MTEESGSEGEGERGREGEGGRERGGERERESERESKQIETIGKVNEGRQKCLTFYS